MTPCGLSKQADMTGIPRPASPVRAFPLSDGKPSPAGAGSARPWNDTYTAQPYRYKRRDTRNTFTYWHVPLLIVIVWLLLQIDKRDSSRNQDALVFSRQLGWHCKHKRLHWRRSSSRVCSPRFKNASKTLTFCVAERVGFEPTVTKKATTVFETAPFVHSGTSPNVGWVVKSSFLSFSPQSGKEIDQQLGSFLTEDPIAHRYPVVQAWMV